MERYVAFLRGINLGKRRVKSPELVGHFEALGLEDVATFRASGNVVFVDPGGEAESKLQARIEAGLEERLGYDVAVFLRSAEEVAAIAARKPFDDAAIAASEGKPQVVLLGRKPSAKARKELEGIVPAGDFLARKHHDAHAWKMRTHQARNFEDPRVRVHDAYA